MMFLSTSQSKRFAAVLIFCCLTTVAWSGEPQFRVDSYIPTKFTDFQWTIDANIRMEGNRRETSNYHVRYDTTDVTVRTKDVQKIEFLSDMDYIYESLSRFVICSLVAGYSLENSSPHNAYSQFSDNDPGVLAQIDAGAYVYNDFFFSIKGIGQWLYRHNLHDVNPDTHYRKYMIDGALTVGWGRYYEGRFAATALNIINELEKDGLIERPADYDELYNLTNKIRHYRISYRPDERLHKIAALQDIIGFLAGRGILRDPGPYGYLLIQDVWDYFPNERRFFGWRIRTGFGFNYLHTTEQTTDETTSPEGLYRHTYEYSKEKNHQPYLTVYAQYSKPFVRRWHLDLESEYRRYLNAFLGWEIMYFSYSPPGGSHAEAQYRRREQYYSYSISAKLRYLFDQRTSMSLTTSHNLSSYHQAYVNYDGQSYERYGYFGVIATIDYRISIPTSLQINMNFSRGDSRIEYRYLHGEYDVSEYFLSMRFVHYLF